jgi:BirA family biotin operon repressor/biotin-[acetyl-CoA-carboxylase] ligase
MERYVDEKICKNVDFLNECEIEAKLKERLSIYKSIKYYKKVTSTQIVVKKMAERGFDEGCVVIAEMQTEGYGRIKRVWDSRPGGLWFSVLLKPLVHPDDSLKLSLLLSIALSRTLEVKYRVSSRIKWPNDVLFLNKKIAGILIEMSAAQNVTNWIVAGVGVNINNSLSENLKSVAISLKMILKKEIDRTEFIVIFLMDFEKLYHDFKKYGFGQFVKEYNCRIAYRWKSVVVGSVIGTNLGIDGHGKLIVKTKNGIEKIISGTVRRNYNNET